MVVNNINQSKWAMVNSLLQIINAMVNLSLSIWIDYRYRLLPV